jgi:hypothetical protein
MIVTLFIYFFSSKAIISSLQFGPISIKDLSIVIKIIPILFSLLLVAHSMIFNHRQEVQLTANKLFFNLYKNRQDDSEFKFTQINVFSRIVMPFSYLSEVFKLTAKNFSTTNVVILIILMIPYFFIAIIPLGFEIYMLKSLLATYSNDIFTKVSFILSIWISIIYVYVTVNETINLKKEKFFTS